MILSSLIDKGTFGEVFRGTYRGQQVAIKSVPMYNCNGRCNRPMIDREIDVWKHLTRRGSPHVVSYIDHTIDENTQTAHLISDLAGESLQRRITTMDLDAMSSTEKKQIVYNTLCGVSECHGHGVAHCDIKPSNIVRTESSWKLIDFGSSAFCDSKASGIETPRLTPFYMAPEILQVGSYGQAVDVWAVGVIAFLLHSGGHHPMLPRDGGVQRPAINAIFDAIVKGTIHWDVCDSDDPSFKDFIEQCLELDPETRVDSARAIDHPFFGCRPPRQQNQPT